MFSSAKSLLLWDADGAGGGSAIALATLEGVASLATSDFQGFLF